MTTLTHSTARIIRQLLIDLSIATDGGTWPAFYDREPAAPDNCITVYRTQGTVQSRFMVNGRIVEKHGLQVRVRADNGDVGHGRIDLIRTTLSQGCYQRTVAVSTSRYLVHSIDRMGDVLSIGTESPISMRTIHTVNFVAGIREL